MARRGQPDVRVGRGVRRGGQDLRLHGAAEVRDLLRPLVDEQQDEMDLGMVLGDGLAEVLEQRRLARLGRRDDEPALAAPDGRDQVDDRAGWSPPARRPAGRARAG